MKIVVIGGTGLIGSELVADLTARSPGRRRVTRHRRHTVTGEGLSQAWAGADVVVDVPNSPSFEVAGPEPMRLEDWVRWGLRAAGDQRVVATDPAARYFGIRLGERSLLPGAAARLGATTFDEWLSHQAAGRIR